MYIYQLHNPSGKLIAFEVETTWVSPQHLAKFLSSENGFSDVKVSNSKEHREDQRLKFNYEGIEFVVEEPYGDNSRFWIGPKNTEVSEAIIEKVEAAFLKYRPFPMRKSFVISILFFIAAGLIWRFFKTN